MKNEADNTQMIRKRISTVVATAGLLFSLTALSVALPASTLAAIPDVHAGWGTEASRQLTTAAEPTVVSFGAYVQFKTWARNYDTSTVSQFFLTETNSRTIYSASWSSSTGASGSCPTTTPLSCSFGQLKPGQSIDAVVVMQAPASGTSMPVNLVWSTVGIGHGDSFPVPGSVGLNGTDDFSGRFLITTDLLPVGDLDVTATNQQSTIVYSPTTGIGVTVEDGSGVTSACVPVSKCFGQTSDIHVGNGSAQYGQFKVIVSLHSSEIPKGVNANNLIVYHDGVAITTVCADVPVADCYSVAKFKWGLQVTIWVLHNGKFNIG